jgi:uncharacterized delta-60 repeat protein
MSMYAVSDERLEAVLRQRAGDHAPLDLAAGILDAIASERRGVPRAIPRRNGRMIRLLAVAAVLGTTVSAAVLTGAGRTPDRPLQVEPTTVAEPSAVAPGPSVANPPTFASAFTGLPPMTIREFGMALAIESDGRIVVARHDVTGISLTRFDASGHFDAAATDAVSIVESPWAPNRRAIAVGADGTAVALHDHGATGFELIRYRGDGSIDDTFGDAGHVRSALAEAGPEPLSGTIATSLAISSDGAVFVAGGSGDNDPDDGSDDTRYAIARFTRDGSPDPGFGTGGRTLVDVGPEGDVAQAITVSDDGSPIIVGGSGGLVRLTPAGVPDGAFGTNGVVPVPWCCAERMSLLTPSDGRILVAGLNRQGEAPSVLVRYLPDGSLDPSFSVDGLFETQLHLLAVAVQPDGRVVFAANVSGLWRYLPDGSLDPAFENGTGFPP